MLLGFSIWRGMYGNGPLVTMKAEEKSCEVAPGAIQNSAYDWHTVSAAHLITATITLVSDAQLPLKYLSKNYPFSLAYRVTFTYDIF